jgi:proline racemase
VISTWGGGLFHNVFMIGQPKAHYKKLKNKNNQNIHALGWTVTNLINKYELQ